MAESRTDQLDRYLKLAAELENSAEVRARVDKINMRQRLYHTEWPIERSPNVHYQEDPTPKIVAERAMAKLMAQPPVFECVQDLKQLEVERSADAMLDAVAPGADQQQLRELKRMARVRADRVETTVGQLLKRIEFQQKRSLLQALDWSACITGFAGPIRWMYSPEASAEAGCVPLCWQSLDPRSYFQVDDPYGVGPRLVIYKRRATRGQLEREGWPVHGTKLETLELDAQVTIFDVWEKVRKEKGRKGSGEYELELWHSIIADGLNKDGSESYHREFLKKPVNMAARGLTWIPYIFRPVMPASFIHESYPGDTSICFLDVLEITHGTSSYMMSYLVQQMALAVNPPVLATTHAPTDADVVSPGAVNHVLPGEKIEIMDNPWAGRAIDQTFEVVQGHQQKGTFAAASYGEGARQMSGLMTGRLQQASEVALDPTRETVAAAYGDCLSALSMLAAVYQVEPILTGTELYVCRLPGLSKIEQAQQASNARALAEPFPDGQRFLSVETARALAEIVQDEHEESMRELRERGRNVYMERVKEQQLQMVGQAVGQVNAQREAMAAMQGQQASLGMAQPEPMGPDTGVAQSPLVEQMPEPEDEWAPMQYQPGV